MCGDSPLIHGASSHLLFTKQLVVGEIHRSEICFINSRSPLCFLFDCYCYFCESFHVGEIHRRGDYKYTLVLPSLNRFICFF